MLPRRDDSPELCISTCATPQVLQCSLQHLCESDKGQVYAGGERSAPYADGVIRGHERSDTGAVPGDPGILAGRYHIPLKGVT
jgi:hypothetical protein